MGVIWQEWAEKLRAAGMHQLAQDVYLKVCKKVACPTCLSQTDFKCNFGDVGLGYVENFVHPARLLVFDLMLGQSREEDPEGGAVGMKYCNQCEHPAHDEYGACEEPTGYDHINGDHECGCPGKCTCSPYSGLDWDCPHHGAVVGQYEPKVKLLPDSVMESIYKKLSEVPPILEKVKFTPPKLEPKSTWFDIETSPTKDYVAEVMAKQKAIIEAKAHAMSKHVIAWAVDPGTEAHIVKITGILGDPVEDFPTYKDGLTFTYTKKEDDAESEAWDG